MPDDLRTEQDVYAWVRQLVEARGGYVVHTRDSRGEQVGVPDLIIALPEGVTLWREVKLDRRHTTPEQCQVLRQLLNAGQNAAIWWWPEDRKLIEEQLDDSNPLDWSDVMAIEAEEAWHACNPRHAPEPTADRVARRIAELTAEGVGEPAARLTAEREVAGG